MSSAHEPNRAGHTTRAGLTIPQFEPLPPTSILNRIINKVLAPVFYLLFTIVTAIVVVPVYTVIENFKKGRNSKGGQRFASNQNPNRSSGTNQAADFLKAYSGSYDGTKETKHRHQHHHHHDEKSAQGQ